MCIICRIDNLEGRETIDISRCLNVVRLPPLPVGVKRLYCSHTSLREIESLPEGLETLCVNNSKLEKLPKLPSSLQYLDCSFTSISELPYLPDSITHLFCTGNKNMTCISQLPENLVIFCISESSVVSCCELPKKLYSFSCANLGVLWMPMIQPGSKTNFMDKNTVIEYFSLKQNASIFKKLIFLQRAIRAYLLRKKKKEQIQLEQDGYVLVNDIDINSN